MSIIDLSQLRDALAAFFFTVRAAGKKVAGVPGFLRRNRHIAIEEASLEIKVVEADLDADFSGQDPFVIPE